MAGVKKSPLAVRAAKEMFLTIGRVFATFLMVGIITGCIVASVLTVYILQLINQDNEVDLQTDLLGYTSIMYYYDENGQAKELQRLYNSESNRIWVDYNDIPKYTKDALVAIEDHRYYEHQGVDWRRTFGAFVGQFLPIAGTTSGGGSTITQQLIKNITGDDEVRVDRKVREIFRAVELTKRYSKEQILEAYLNTVPFGHGTLGIEAAANTYFGKEARNLTLAESAAIVGITQYPTKYNPFLYPENNKERREHVLYRMLELKFITQEQYDSALKEKLDFKTAELEQKSEYVQSYFVDYVTEQVIKDLMEKKGYTYNSATKRFYEGGYRIFTTVDMQMQLWLDEVYQNTDLFPPVRNEEYPQSACVITDINGKILAMEGGIGKKEGARVHNRATDSLRQPGSSIKPLATYALAFENNRVTWSTMVDDHPINRAQPGQPEKWWPVNHYGSYDGMITVDRAINWSVNTVAVKVLNLVGVQNAFNFLKYDLNFHSLIEREAKNGQINSDNDLAPMSIGALTYGVTPLEMAGGYQIFANGGYFTSPYAYTKVEDSNGRIILETDTTPRQVISEDTSVVLNKLLQRVVTVGTAKSANLMPTMPSGGKTGTTDKDIDQWFLGITPDYVCQVWLGYDIPIEMKVNPNTGTRQPVTNTIYYNSYPPPILWKTIMQPLVEKQEYKPFLESDNVVSMTYCTISGNLAGAGCPGVATGWYKTSRIPPTCNGNHAAPNTDGSSSSGTSGSSGASSGSSSRASSSSSKPESSSERG